MKGTEIANVEPVSRPTQPEYSRRGMPFMPAMVQAVRELRRLPPERTSEDYPENNIYLVGDGDNLLVRVSRRRPEKSYGRVVDYPAYGLFAEALYLDNGKPKFVIPEKVFQCIPNGRHFVGSGLYERTEVTDEYGDPYNSVVPPTVFIRALTELFGGSDVPLLPSEAEKQIGPVGRLIRNRQGIFAGQESDRVGRERLVASIRERFPKSNQGLAADITNAHLIVTDRDENDELFHMSRKMGLTPYRLSASRLNSCPTREILDKNPITDIITGKIKGIPLAITCDNVNRLSLPNLETRFCSLVDKLPSYFSIMIINKAIDGNTVIYRAKPGWYDVFGGMTEVEGLLRKTGLDFVLTHQARDMEAMF